MGDVDSYGLKMAIVEALTLYFVHIVEFDK